MGVILAAYTIQGSTLVYSIQDMVERDPLLGDVPPLATVQGDVVTVDLALLDVQV